MEGRRRPVACRIHAVVLAAPLLSGAASGASGRAPAFANSRSVAPIRFSVGTINLDCSAIPEQYLFDNHRTVTVMVRSYEHPDPKDVSLPRVLFALSDPVRLRMVRILAGCEAINSMDLGPGMPKSTVTHHTRILREAGVTRTRPEGRNCWISLRREVLDTKFPGLLGAVLAAEAEE